MEQQKDIRWIQCYANYTRHAPGYWEIDDLGFLYSIDLLDYQQKKGTPIGDRIDRVGQVFYEAA